MESRPMPRHVWLDGKSIFDEVIRRPIFDNWGNNFQDCQPSHHKHSRVANTLAHQDKVQLRFEVMNRPNACPMKNKDEHVEMPQRKVQQPQLNGLPAWSGAAWIQRSWNTFTNTMASPSIFVLQRRVVEQLPFYIHWDLSIMLIFGSIVIPVL